MAYYTNWGQAAWKEEITQGDENFIKFMDIVREKKNNLLINCINETKYMLAELFLKKIRVKG